MTGEPTTGHMRVPSMNDHLAGPRSALSRAGFATGHTLCSLDGPRPSQDTQCRSTAACHFPPQLLSFHSELTISSKGKRGRIFNTLPGNPLVSTCEFVIQVFPAATGCVIQGRSLSLQSEDACAPVVRSSLLSPPSSNALHVHLPATVLLTATRVPGWDDPSLRPPLAPPAPPAEPCQQSLQGHLAFLCLNLASPILPLSTQFQSHLRGTSHVPCYF